MADTNLESSRHSQDIVVSAPGKVILFGEHSVVYGHLALAASLELRTKVTISPIKQPDVLEISCSNFTTKETYKLKSLNEYLLEPELPTNRALAEFNWELHDALFHETLEDRVNEFVAKHPIGNQGPQQLTTIKSILYLIAGMLGSVDLELKPVSITVTTELEMGSGLGSSASFLVSIAAALVQYIKINKKPGNVSKPIYKESNLDDLSLNTFSNRELEIICNWAYLAEKIVHGTPSGLDNTICTYGSIVEFRKGLPAKSLEIKLPLEILLINTKVPRETKALVSAVAKFRSKCPELVKHILLSMEEVAFIALNTLFKFSNSQVSDRPTSAQACYATLGTLCSTNHHLLAALGVSHPSLDDAVTILSRRGLRGKLTGAGGGGFAFGMVPPSGGRPGAVEEAVAELTARGYEVRRAALGGEGVRVEV